MARRKQPTIPDAARFGCRRHGLLLSREGVRLNHKKLRRIYTEERLQVRRRGRRKRALGTRAPIALPDAVNQRWSLDFVPHTFSDGRRFRMLCVVGDLSRECLALVADTGFYASWMGLLAGGACHYLW